MVSEDSFSWDYFLNMGTVQYKKLTVICKNLFNNYVTSQNMSIVIRSKNQITKKEFKLIRKYLMNLKNFRTPLLKFQHQNVFRRDLLGKIFILKTK